MKTDKVLAIGWDVGGMVGSNQAVAMYEKNGDGWEHLGTEGFSLKRKSIKKWPITFEWLLELIGDYERDQYTGFDKILAIDSPFDFPAPFKQWLKGIDGGWPKEQIDDEYLVQNFYQTLGFRQTDQYIEKTFSYFENSRPFSPVHNRITNQTILVKSLIDDWGDDPDVHVLPFDDDPGEGLRIIEVYPKLVKKDGKSKETIRTDIELPKDGCPSERGTDQYDAEICAVHAMALLDEESNELNGPEALNLNIEVESEEELIAEEGWIYHFSPPNPDD